MIDLYNLIHSKNYNFFEGNKRTENKDLNELIDACLKSDPN